MSTGLGSLAHHAVRAASGPGPSIVNRPRSRTFHLGIALAAATVAAIPLTGQPITFAHLAGSQNPGFEDGLGPACRFNAPHGVAIDASGNIYIADTDNHTIRKITPFGNAATLAGLAGAPGSNDGVGAAARFNRPIGIAVDAAGHVFVADSTNSTIRKITPFGEVTTLAGLAGSTGSSDGAGTDARFYHASALAIDRAGNLVVADTYNHVIRRITPSGDVTTLAGVAGSYGSRDGTGQGARFYNPSGVAVDSAGNIYVGDLSNHTIRRITLSGSVTTVAGLAGSYGYSDGVEAAARFYSPTGLAIDAADDVLVADQGNDVIRKVTPSGAVTTVAGLAGNPGSRDGVGTAARFYRPTGVAVDTPGNVLVTDTFNHAIRKVTPAREVTTLAGQAASFGASDGDGPAARFSFPAGVATDPSGNVFVADYGNNTVRKITPDGSVSTLAGLAGYFGSSDGIGNAARFSEPSSVAADLMGNIYVADTLNHTIRKVTSSGNVTTLAGIAGHPGASDGAGTTAQFNYPTGVTVDATGNLFVADNENHIIRKITPSGAVTTLAGLGGQPGSSDGIGIAARFYHPTGLAVDASGNVFVADAANSTVRKITSVGAVTTVVGLAGIAGATDGNGSAARFNHPSGLAVDKVGNILVADRDNHTIRNVTPAGEVTTVGGLALSPGATDGMGPAVRFNWPYGVAVSTSGTVYVADTRNHSIRVGEPALADVAVIDFPTGLVGVPRHLDTEPQTATNWQWSVIRRPAGSIAEVVPADARDPLFTPDAVGLYTFRLTANSVAGTSITTVSLDAKCASPPALAVSGPSQVCAGDSVTLDAGSGYASYLWSPGGQTTQAITIAPVSTTTYSVAVRDTLGCGAISADHVVAVVTCGLYDLSVTNEGTGSGTVASAPAGINCGSTCNASFDAGSVVTLTATPAAGSLFSVWTGACSGAGVCTVTMDQAKSVTAAFVVPTGQTSHGNVLIPNENLGGLQEVAADGSIVNFFPLPPRYSFVGGRALWTALVRPSDHAILVNARDASGAPVVLALDDRGALISAQAVASDFVQQIAFDPLDAGLNTVLAGIPFQPGVAWVDPFAEATGNRIIEDSLNAIGIVVDGAERIYVADFWTATIRLYGSAGTFLGVFANIGSDVSRHVRGMAIDPAGNLYGAAVDRIVKYSPDGAFLGSLTHPQLNDICCVLYNRADGLLYATNQNDDWLAVMTPAGEPIRATHLGGNSVAGTPALVWTPAQTLTVTAAGSGAGTVLSSPSGIDCGTTCSAEFTYGTSVTLSASADIGSAFIGWSGEGCGGAGTCAVTLDQARSVTATFALNAFALTVIKAGLGNGTVTSVPAALDCGVVCTSEFPSGTPVGLTAAASPGSMFAGWSGEGCSGAGVCSVTMDAAKSITATFELAPIATERQALLDLYNATNGPGWANSTNWGGPPGTECTWFGVGCDPAQTTVVALWLYANNLVGTLPTSLGTLTNLEVLSLNQNRLSGSLPAELGHLTHLVSVDAWGNQFTGQIPDLHASAGLVDLYLGLNRFDPGPFPHWLGGLTQLKHVWLGGCNLTGPIPASIDSLTNLETLGLGGNQLTGPIPDLSALTGLTSLSLEMNPFEPGPIPGWVSTLPRLHDLWLGWTNRTGVVPDLGSLGDLTELYLDSNAFDPGPVPAWLTNLTKLRSLGLSNCNLIGPIPPWLGTLTSLQHLRLSQNQLSGPIPSELGRLTQLEGLDLWGNPLSGAIPDLHALTRLTTLYLGGHQFDAGPVPAWLGELAHLRYLTLWSCHLTGPIPDSLGSLTALEVLSLSDNHLTGSIPEFGALTSLTALNLDRNQLTGPIPDLSSLTNLTALRLDDNAFDPGPIPDWIPELPDLQSLGLSVTNRTGAIPDLGALVNLAELYLGGNPFDAAPIPTWINSLANLKHLSLWGCNLSGSIPALPSALTNLESLDVSFNQLSGPIPDLGGLTQLSDLYLAGNAFDPGPIPIWIPTLARLRGLGLGATNRTGSIPPELGTLGNLHWLFLDWNRLTGPIPAEMGGLTQLEALQLNSNQLVGPLPNSLMGLSRLGAGQLNLQWNALYSLDSGLTAFLNSRQAGGDWQGTQTVAPTGLVASEVAATSVTLSWTPIAYTGDSGGYQAYVATASDGPYIASVSTADKNAATLVVPELAPNTSYYFLLRTITNPHANNQNALVSEPSKTVNVTTPICQPMLSVAFPPSADPLSFTDGYDVQLNGTATTSPGCPGIASLQWDWGDGTVDVQSFPATHHYQVHGAYSVIVTAFDAGVPSHTATISGTVVIEQTPGSTEPGTNVAVQPVDPVTGTSPATITFGEVTNSGVTTLAIRNHGTPPDTGFRLVGNIYFEITTDASFAPPVRVCIYYGSIGANENALHLKHFVAEGGVMRDGSICSKTNGCWEDVTDLSYPPTQPNPDTVNKIICGTANSLSPFAIVEAIEMIAPLDPKPVDTTIEASLALSDPAAVDETEWTWGDGSTSAGELVADQVTGSHSYTTPGTYTVGLRLLYGGFEVGSAVFQCVVIYDPNSGFVTGGGWIASPSGAYVPDPVLMGQANFGFVSAYKKGQSAPTGTTEFQFQVANLNFHSSTYDWLVVAGARAQFKGVGTINGQGSYGFMLTAIDGALPGGGGADKFRMKIWEKATGVVVYDNQLGAADDGDPTTVIGGGSIVIHKPK